MPTLDEMTLLSLVPKLFERMEQGVFLALVVADAETGEILGSCNLHQIDRHLGQAEVGYWLFPAARGRGVATRTARFLAEHAFSLGFERIEARVFDDNPESERVLVRAGFTREGVLRSLPTSSGRPGQHDPLLAAPRRMKTLVVYLMAGRDTPELAEAAVAAGADIVELGFPFSDPLADGPVIRRAAERALADGMRTRRCLECLAETRARVDVPLIPMTYASLLEAYGYERFEADARAAGATSLIVADLPAGERPELRRVQLVAPTSTDGRIQIAARHTDGWLYLVTVTGTTGARERLSPSLAGLVARTRSLTDLPLYAGFGISTPEQAAEAAELADGIVVGSRAVEVAEDGPDALQAYVETLRAAIAPESAR